MKKPLKFICSQKIKFIFHVFLAVLQRYCKLVLGTLDMSGYTNPKWYYQLVENFHIYLQAKNQLYHHDFLETRKDMQTSFLGWFWHAWLHTPKMIASPCRRLHVYLHAKINFVIHFLLEVLHFKESCNFIGWQHFDL